MRIKYYAINHYVTEWTDNDNVVISLYEGGEQVGIIEVAIYKTGEHKGSALIWNLHVREEHRGKGYGKALLDEAYRMAVENGCERATLEWSDRDTPKWVLDWYVRDGWEESEFGRDSALLVKPITNKIMAQFIDKAAITAEIKRLIRANELYLSEPKTDEMRFQKVGAYSVLNDLLHFLDTLEVKEKTRKGGER